MSKKSSSYSSYVEKLTALQKISEQAIQRLDSALTIEGLPSGISENLNFMLKSCNTFRRQTVTQSISFNFAKEAEHLSLVLFGIDDRIAETRKDVNAYKQAGVLDNNNYKTLLEAITDVGFLSNSFKNKLFIQGKSADQDRER